MKLVWFVLLLLVIVGVNFSASSQTKSALELANVPKAWNITKGKPSVKVAVIDTGVDVKSVPGTIPGWNFVNNNADIADFNGHGTHVAGIIRQVAPNVSILPIKFYADSNTGEQNKKNLVLAINYAVAQKVKIINISGGGAGFSDSEYRAILNANYYGVLVVAAAGNDKSNVDNDLDSYYPCSYFSSNILCVAALSESGAKLASFSNWGPNKVSIAAPGENVYSTLPWSGHGFMSGTSQATAIVSGVAALVFSKHPKASAANVKRLILGSANKLPALTGLVSSGGTVDAYKALYSILINH